MKKLFSISTFFLILTNLYSQNYKYQINDFVNVNNITANSFEFYNKQNYTIKIKQVDVNSNEVVKVFIVEPKTSLKLEVKAKYISKEVIDNLMYETYYDAQCLEKDLNRINNLKKQKQEDEEIFTVFKNLFNSAAIYISESQPETSLGKYSKKYLDIKGYVDRVNKWKDEGILQAEINSYQDKIVDDFKNKLIDKNFSDKEVRGIVKGLDAFIMSDFSTNVDFTEFDNQINYLIALTSNIKIKTYFLPYNVFFKPHIDFDGDGITNDNDECREIAGLSKYNGCTKKLFYNTRKKTYEIAIELGIIPHINYTYKNKDGFENLYDDFSLQNSKFIRIINYFNTNKNSMFYIPIQYSFSEKYDGILEKNVSSTTTNASYSKMSFQSFDLNIGYLWKLFGNKSFNTSLTIEGGVNHSIFNITERQSGSFDTNGNIILFNLTDVEDNQTSVNAGIGFILDFDYVSLDLRYNALLSVGKEETDTTPQSELKNKMNGSSIQVGLKIPIYRRYNKK